MFDPMFVTVYPLVLRHKKITLWVYWEGAWLKEEVIVKVKGQGHPCNCCKTLKNNLKSTVQSLLMKLSWKIDKNWQLFVRSMSKVKVIDVYKNLTHITVKKTGLSFLLKLSTFIVELSRLLSAWSVSISKVKLTN